MTFLRMRQRTLLVRTSTAAMAAVLLTVGLVSCAPEPMAGDHIKGEEPREEDRSWSQIDDQDDPALKSAELPEGFPTNEFALPEGGVIDDAGQRGDRVWFLVLKAPDSETAEAWWQSIIESNGFVVRDDEQGEDGSASAVFASDRVTTSALRIPEPDGSVLLSFDITQEL